MTASLTAFLNPGACLICRGPATASESVPHGASDVRLELAVTIYNTGIIRRASRA